MSQKINKKKYEPSDLVAAGKAIIYYKNYRDMCGSVNSAVLFNQLEFRFFSTGGKPFYKYLSPLKEEINGYKKGDSWTEELGFSESEFRTSFGKMGIAYKCKKDFDRAGNKFKGIKTLHKIKNKRKIAEKVEFEGMFCSYHNKRSGQTFYFRNHELITSNLKKLREQVKNNPYELKINIPVNKETQSTEIGTSNPEYNTENTSEKTSEKIYLCYTTGEPVLDNASFMWQTPEGYNEYLDNETKESELTIYINRNIDKNGNVKNNKNTVAIKITPLKMEALIDYHIEKNFSRLNDSYETLLTNSEQRHAVRRMLTNRRIGHNGITFRTLELETMQKWAEDGFNLTEDILELGNTPVRMMYNYGSIRYTFNKWDCSDAFYTWLKLDYPDRYDAIFKIETVEQKKEIDTS